MPSIKMSQDCLGQRGRSEAFVPGCLHKPLTREAVKGVADWGHACVEILGKERWLEPVSRTKAPFAQLISDRRIDPLEGAWPAH